MVGMLQQSHMTKSRDLAGVHIGLTLPGQGVSGRGLGQMAHIQGEE